MNRLPMKRTVTWQTVDCIMCGKPAKLWGGAVRFGREWVLAGWCNRHKMQSHWFHGDYSPRFGRERIKER